MTHFSLFFRGITVLLMFGILPAFSQQFEPKLTLSISDFMKWETPGPGVANEFAVPENISTVPLAPREFISPTQLNPSHSFAAKINYSPDGMDIWSAYTKEQSKFNMYNFTHWQYIDVFTWFTGQIGIPGRPWIEAAHRNGVKIIGSVFPRSTSENNELVRKDNDGNYVGVQKLVDIANYYGFDGWFFNIESFANGAEMINFLKELQRIRPEGMEIHWYDAMVPSGSISYQNMLNNNNARLLQDGAARVSDAMFTNYWWGASGIATTEATAASIGRSPFDVYTGADLWPGRSDQPMFRNNTWIDICYANGDLSKPRTSIALFATNLTYNSGLANFNNDPGDYANFYKVESRMFAGDDFNSATTEASGWKGFGHYIPVRASATSLPFITYFNVGQGKVFAANGQKVSRDWTDMGKQDLMPSWQWAVTGSASLTASFDFDDAYNGGTSIKLVGNLNSNDATIRLYQTKLAIAADTRFDLIVKQAAAGPTHLKLALYFSDDLANPTYLNISDAEGPGWETKTIDLSEYAGRELAVIGFKTESSGSVPDYAINLGGIRIYNGSIPGKPVPAFLASQTNIILGESVTFSNITTNAESFVWTFEGGTPATSTEVNPQVVYNSPGTFLVSLEATNQNGTETERKAAYITVTAPPPPANRVLEFDGGDQYLNVGVMQLSGSALTLEGWIKADGFKDVFPNISTMMGIEGGALLRFGDAGLAKNRLQFATSLGNLSSSTFFETGKWYHVAATYDGNTMIIYVNGVVDATMTRRGSLNANGDFNIAYSYNASRGFNGAMDELRVWKKALTISEIQANMCEVDPATPLLEAYWKCDEGIGSFTRDMTGHGYPARLMQMGIADWNTNTPPACEKDYFVYRSNGDVDLASITNWEVFNGTNWVAPSVTNPAPTGKATSILIREGHSWSNNISATTIPIDVILTHNSSREGTFNPDFKITNLGEIVLTGTSPQLFPGAEAFEDGHWGDITVNNSAGVSTTLNGTNLVSVHNLKLLDGTLTVTSDTRTALTLEGQVTRATGKLALTAPSGMNDGLILKGTANQTLPEDLFESNEVENLVVDNREGVTIAGSLTISGALTFTNGIVTILEGNLTVEDINNAAPGKHVVISGGGGLRREAGSALADFPVGTSATSFTPLTIDNTKGAVDNFVVRVERSIDELLVEDASRVMPVVWYVSEEVPGGSEAVLTFQWNESDVAGASGFTSSSGSKVIGHYTGSSWEKQLVNVSGSDPFLAKNQTPYTSFSPFAVAMDGALDGTALPLQLISFNASQEQSAIHLSWTTIEEVDMSHFEVERSVDGADFLSIGRVPTQNSMGIHQYSFQDENPLLHTGYYRLRIVNLDGTYELSKILSLKGQGERPKTEVYPNPGSGVEMVTLKHGPAGDEALVTIVAADGRELSSVRVLKGAIKTSIDVSSLSGGVYIIRYVNNGISTYSRLIK